MELNENIKEEIITFCDNTDDESVGVVLEVKGKQVFMPFRNISEHAIVRYKAEPQDFFDIMKDTELFGGKDRIVCFVHSHPFGMKNPSSIDIDNAYERYNYVIYWGGGFTKFRVDKGKAKMEAIQ